MTLKDSVQTAILVVGFFSLLVFGASYYFVLIDPDSSNYPLKEALSITASFFGGFATLTAAYIASKLFNDWKHEYNKNTENEYLKSALNYIREIQVIEKQCRIALELSDFSLKYGILKSLDNITLDKNNNKLVLLLNEYCQLFKDDEFKKTIEYYDKFGLQYTVILSTIKHMPPYIELSPVHILFLKNLLDTTVQINGKNYKYKNIFNGIDITNIQKEIFNRIFAK